MVQMKRTELEPETPSPKAPEPPPKRKPGRPRKHPESPWVDPLAATVGTNNTGRSQDFTVPPPELTCEGCDRTVATEEFSVYLEAVAAHKLQDLEGSTETPPDRICNYCARYGVPMENPLAILSKPEIEALAVLAAGGSMRRAAVVMGVSERQIRAYLTGREKNVLRAAYQKLLLQEGITPQAIAKVIYEALSAERPHWDSLAERFVFFPDHNTRLKAAQMGQRILQLEQPTELSARSPEEHGPAITFHTNLGDGATVSDGAYTIDVRPASALPAPMKQVN